VADLTPSEAFLPSEEKKGEREMSKKEKGGVALEYVLVSTFATIVTSVALCVLGGFIKQKMTEFSKKYDIEVNLSDFDLFK
jgi:hypothetical protein